MGKIGISTGEMKSLTIEMSNGLLKLKEAKQRLNSAIQNFSLKNKSKSTRIELTNLQKQAKVINDLEDKITKMNSNVNTMITKFSEVDKKCESKIRVRGYDYRKKIGLLTMGEKIGDNPLGNSIDGIESWYDRNKFVVKKATTIVLEIGAIGIFVYTLPETLTAGLLWECMTFAGAGMSADNIVTASTSIYQRKVEKKGEEDSSGYDVLQSIFGGVGWYSAKLVGAKDPSYWCSCGKTGYDRIAATITVANIGHGFASLGDDMEKLPGLEAEASNANETLDAAKDAERIHTEAMMGNKYKINEINNAQKEVIDLKKIKRSMSKSNFEPYKNQFYNDKNLLKRDANKLPQLQQDLLKQQDELGIFNRNTLNAENEYRKNVTKISKTYKDIKANLYNLPAGGVLYNTEGTQDSFHFNYVPDEMKSIEDGIKSIPNDIKSIFGGKK